MRRFAILALGLMSACATDPALPTGTPAASPISAAERADRWFADGDCQRASEAYDALLNPQVRDDEAARLLLLRTLARMQCSPSLLDGRHIQDLRSIARAYPHSPWGAVATLVAGQAQQSQELEYAKLKLEARLATLDLAISDWEVESVARSGELQDAQQQLTTLRDHKQQCQQDLSEAVETGQDLRRRLDALTRELAALKRIDMQREP